MNQISDEIIMDKVMNVYTQYIQQYSNNNILGVFLLGRFNYGWGRTENDYKFVVLYLPTFENLCTSFPKNVEKNEIHFIDIRYLYNATKDADWSCIELLFAKYRYINPKYEYIFKKAFDDKKELIARYNEQKRLDMAYVNAVKAFANNDFFEVARLYLGAKNYSQPKSLCEDSFHLKNIVDISFLDTIEKEQKLDSGLMLLNEMVIMVEKANPRTNLEAEAALKEGIVACISAALNQGVSADSFKNTLTATEQKAFVSILSKLENGEGNISISKIIEETKISRPVYKNLFTKMEKAKVAEINNQGVKGMLIKMKAY